MKTLSQRLKEWLFFAQSDLEFGQTAFREKRYHHTCFLTQQCVEKSLKALLLKSSGKIAKIHTLTTLIGRLKKEYPQVEKFISGAVFLDKFYKPTRYPDALPGSLLEGLPRKEDARKALEIAEKIFEFAKKILVS